MPEEAKKLLHAWAKLHKEDNDLTSAVNETSVERPDGVRFCNPAFGTSAPASHVLSTKTRATGRQQRRGAVRGRRGDELERATDLAQRVVAPRVAGTAAAAHAARRHDPYATRRARSACLESRRATFVMQWSHHTRPSRRAIVMWHVAPHRL